RLREAEGSEDLADRRLRPVASQPLVLRAQPGVLLATVLPGSDPRLLLRQAPPHGEELGQAGAGDLEHGTAGCGPGVLWEVRHSHSRRPQDLALDGLLSAGQQPQQGALAAAVAADQADAVACGDGQPEGVE